MTCFLSSFFALPARSFLISLAMNSFSTSSRIPFLLSSMYFSSLSSADGA